MPTYDEVLLAKLGDSDSIADIRAVARRCFFYDIDGYPTYLWNGPGRLHTTEGLTWLGTIAAGGKDLHKAPSVTDGRDGSSPTYQFSLQIIDTPGLPAYEVYNALRNEQWRVTGRPLTIYLVIFDDDDGLRPKTPKKFFKELTMKSTKFSEKIEWNGSAMIKRYVVTVVAKDGNFGRANIPGGTYADATQKQRARELGVELDRGCEFVAKLANETIQIP